MVTEQDEKKEGNMGFFYNNLLGTAGQREVTLNLQSFHQPAVDLSELDQVITEEEVWPTIRTLPSDKAPRPDGYTGRFYKVASSDQSGFHGSC